MWIVYDFITEHFLQQSKIMDAKYFQERQPPEEEKLDNEFKARLPKKLEHVVS